MSYMIDPVGSSVVDGDESAAKRAVKRIERLYAKIRSFPYHIGDPEEFVTDVLVYLRHFCDANHIGFGHCNDMAQGHYTEEHKLSLRRPT